MLELTVSDCQQFADELENGFKKAAQLLAEEKLPPLCDPVHPPFLHLCKSLRRHRQRQHQKENPALVLIRGLRRTLRRGQRSPVQPRPPRCLRVSGLRKRSPYHQRCQLRAPPSPFAANPRRCSLQGPGRAPDAKGGKDFVSGTPIDLHTYFNNAIDIHHIFPKAWCSARTLPKEKWNSVINKTPLSSKNNQYLGGDAPSVYIRRIEEKKGVPAETLDACLRSHAIPIEALRQNAFNDFIRQRAIQLST